MRAEASLRREDDVTYATVKFAEAPSSQQQQQTDPSCTADPTPPVSAAGKASSYRQPALVLLILCCLLLAAVISLAVHHSRTKEDPEKYTSLTTDYSSLLNQLQHNNRLNETHSELQSNYSKLSGSHSKSNYSDLTLQSNYSGLNETHSELQSNYSKLLQNQSQLLDEKNTLQKDNPELKKNNTELSVKSSLLDKHCPLKEGSSKEWVCCPEKWVQFNGKCYYFSTDTMNWNSSRASCVSMGADLVIIESETEQKAGQLAPALDGKALQVLLDLGPDELDSYDVIATALDHRFGRVEPAVGLCQRLATRIRGPGLTPNALRQQVRLAAPTSLELALAHAERVEPVLEEGERDWASGGNQQEGREWTDRPRPTACQAQAEEEETADSHAALPWISDLAALIEPYPHRAPTLTCAGTVANLGTYSDDAPPLQPHPTAHRRKTPRGPRKRDNVGSSSCLPYLQPSTCTTHSWGPTAKRGEGAPPLS
ncbi:UNVERIFIED_CONTAM: hypothetical protein FKN15_003877 [Acipenser sinensis]